MSAHNFDATVALTPNSNNVFLGNLTPSYNNMVGPFGGTTAATLLNAVMQHPDRLGDPVSLTVNFAGPLALGEFSIEATPMRTNNSTQHWLIVQRQNGEVATLGTAFFALRRDTWAEQELSAPEAPHPSSLAQVQVLAKPHWVENYDIRFVEGEFNPMAGKPQANSRSLMWVRDFPERVLDFQALSAIGDSFFPRVFIRHQEPMPAGTVSLTLQFHCTAEQLESVGSGYLLGEAQANRAHQNYVDQTAHFWNEQGDLMLSSHQMMYFKK